jgi:hypothetical protein
MMLEKMLNISPTYNTHDPILTPEAVAVRFDKSVKWVYKHAPELGGSKIGGSWFFTEGGLSDALQRGQQLARGRNHKPKKSGAESLSIETGRRQVGKGRKKKTDESENRHGLAGALQ